MFKKLNKLTDEHLLRRVRRGNERAFAELYDRHAGAVYDYVRRNLGGDTLRAEDLTQETFLRVVKYAERFDAERSFRAWLFTIVANLVRNEYRRRARRPAAEPLEGALPALEPDDFTTELDRATFRAELDRTLAELTETERQVILLRYRAELTVPEIAAALEMPVGSVKSKLHYTLKKLETRLGAFRQLSR